MSTRRLPSLNWLRVFEAAARTGSFSRAAKVLHMSAAAVSQQVRALENHLGRDLFHRGPRSVTLTDVGRAYLTSVARSLHAVDLSTASLFGTRDAEPLTLRCSLMLATAWLAPRLSAFRTANPNINLTLTTGIYEDEFQRHGADLRIVFGLPAEAGEESDPLFGETLYPVAPAEIASTIRRPEDLAQWPLIEIATHRANWWNLLPPDGPQPEFRYTDNSLLAYALATDGAVALARAPASDGLPERFGLDRCLPDLAVTGVQSYALAYPSLSGLSRSARLFRDWLLAEAAVP